MSYFYESIPKLRKFKVKCNSFHSLLITRLLYTYSLTSGFPLIVTKTCSQLLLIFQNFLNLEFSFNQSVSVRSAVQSGEIILIWLVQERSINKYCLYRKCYKIYFHFLSRVWSPWHSISFHRPQLHPLKWLQKIFHQDQQRFWIIPDQMWGKPGLVWATMRGRLA